MAVYTTELDFQMIKLVRNLADTKAWIEQQIDSLREQFAECEITHAKQLEALKAAMIAAGRDAGTIDEHIERVMEQAFEKKTAA